MEKITVSRKKAKILTVNRKSHSPLRPSENAILVYLSGTPMWRPGKKCKQLELNLAISGTAEGEGLVGSRPHPFFRPLPPFLR